MKIVNGKFYKNGVEVKPVFGDPEQIRLIRHIEMMRENGVTECTIDNEEETRYTGYLEFTCPSCMGDNRYEYASDQLYPIDAWDVDGDTIICEECSTALKAKQVDRNKLTLKIDEDTN